MPLVSRADIFWRSPGEMTEEMGDTLEETMGDSPAEVIRNRDTMEATTKAIPEETTGDIPGETMEVITTVDTPEEATEMTEETTGRTGPRVRRRARIQAVVANSRMTIHPVAVARLIARVGAAFRRNARGGVNRQIH